MSFLATLAATTILLSGQAEQFVAYQADPPDRKLAATQLADVDGDFAYQGEYLGQVRAVDGRPVVLGLQVVALGDGEFTAKGYQDGLPGNGWDRATMISWKGARQDGLLKLDGPRGQIIIQGGGGLIIDSVGTAVGQVVKVRRVSTTMGAPQPDGATVLFDGTNTEAFENGKMTEEGWLDVGALTRSMVDDFRLHLEFRLPYMPFARSQGRANSGVYIQRRYEVQILDSFGLEPMFNDCAALYRQQVPDLNMSFPPLDWQTYDIFFTAARWDEAGEKTADARITVYHNGIAVHKDRVVPTKTGAGKTESPEPGPILLQDHGNPVRFRNVWLVVGQQPAVAPAAVVAAAAVEQSVLAATTAQTAEVVTSVSQPMPVSTRVLETCESCGSGRHAPTWHATGSVRGGCANCSNNGWILWRGNYPY